MKTQNFLTNNFILKENFRKINLYFQKTIDHIYVSLMILYGVNKQSTWYVFELYTFGVNSFVQTRTLSK